MMIRRLCIALSVLIAISLLLRYFQAGAVPWWSVLPPLVSITLVAATRALIVPLLLGATTAAVFAGWPDPFSVGHKLVVDYIGASIFDLFKLAILAFTAVILGMVHVATQSGGTQGVVQGIMRFAKDARGVCTATAAMGIAVFFDDYANTAIIGPTMRPICDKFHISREKLAYLIDSTAAPVAGLAVISTWVGAEVGYLQDAAQGLGVSASGYELFFAALPYRFYCIFTIILVFALCLMHRDFGPMLVAERRARHLGQVLRPGAKPLAMAHDIFHDGTPPPPRWQNAVVPVLVVLGIILVCVYWLGTPVGTGLAAIASGDVWRDAFVHASEISGGNAMAYIFLVASIAGAAVAMIMPAMQGVQSLPRSFKVFASGVRSMGIAFGVLVLAWALSAGCKELGTATFAVDMLRGRLAPGAIPLTIFVVSGLVAFATGTSWGTMAILLPTAGPLGFHAGGLELMVISMAAVLDGAIFGDHCSPISDTTVLSSMCSACDHIDHVRTQMPYAMVGAATAGLVGYGLVAAGGAPLWAGYACGAVLLIGIVRWVGQDPSVGLAPVSEEASAPVRAVNAAIDH